MMKNKNYYLFLGVCMFLLFSCHEKANVSGTTDSKIDSVAVFAELPGKKVFDVGIEYSRMQAQGDSKINTLTTPNIGNCGTTLPSQIKDLLSGTKYFYYKFDSETKAQASAMGFTGSFDKKDIVIIRDFVRYKKITCDGKSKDVGIGLRCYIQIKSYKAKLGGSLSAIAASVENGQANASFSIESLGFPIEGKDIAGVVTQGDYDVDNFASLAILHSRILATLNSDNHMLIDPVELPLDKAQQSPF